jgi:two-component system cell cycle sensor histidine kinase/response regulator CckA
VLMSMAGEEGRGWAEAKEIEIAATRAADLVSQLLAFSRSQVMQATVVDVNDAIRKAQQMLEPLTGEIIELRLSLDADVGNVSVDPMQLEQAIVNLAVNALDAMPSGGTLHIRTHNVVVTEGSGDLVQLQPGSYTALAVEDTGLGMDAVTRARVFEPFFSTKGVAKGTGLGLSAVYGMVKQSGGDITITSAPGEGTSVTVYLPHAVAAVAGVAERRVGPTTSQDETVLLVEDDEKARALVGRVLRESGYSVHEAALPDEALRLCDEFDGRIHLLLSDVVMPQMSGPKLAKLVLERRPETRVMFVSGYIERPDDADGIASGADFLQKPFTPTQLVETVRRVLDNETVKA